MHKAEDRERDDEAAAKIAEQRQRIASVTTAKAMAASITGGPMQQHIDDQQEELEAPEIAEKMKSALLSSLQSEKLKSKSMKLSNGGQRPALPWLSRKTREGSVKGGEAAQIPSSPKDELGSLKLTRMQKNSSSLWIEDGCAGDADKGAGFLISPQGNNAWLRDGNNNTRRVTKAPWGETSSRNVWMVQQSPSGRASPTKQV